MEEMATTDGVQEIQPREQRVAGFWRRFRRNKLAVFGLVVVAILLLTAVFAPLIAPSEPDAQDYALTLRPREEGGLIGADSLGSDVFSRGVYGARISLESSLISVGIAVLVGVPIGLVSGCETAKATGTGNTMILLRHVLPNSLPPLLVQTTLAIGYAIIAEATLSFLGLGAEPGDPSWGSMLFQAKSYLSTAWWMAFFPCMALFFAVLGFNLLGDSVRGALDPRTYD